MLLWLLSALLAVGSAYVVQGWLRQALRLSRPLLGWHALGIVGLTWGSLVTAVAVLSIASAALPFPVGYRPWVPVGVWAGSMVASVLALWGLLWRRPFWMCLVAGGLLAAAALPAMIAMVWAAGFRPGVVWQRELLAAAGLLLALGSGAALWIGLSESALNGQRRPLWRLGAAVLMGLSAVAAQELVTVAAGLKVQVGSVFQHQLSAGVLALAAGGVLPLLLVFLLIDLEMRRHAQRQRRRGGDTSHLKLKKREKRRSHAREA